MNLLSAALLLSGLLLLWSMHRLRRWGRTFRHFSQHHRVCARDGISLSLYRYTALTSTDGPPPVVVLCADVGEVPALWEHGPTGGVAHKLQTLGYDVWVICLRGTDLSRPQPLQRESGWGWWTETMVQDDLPVYLEEIKRHTGATTVHWIGRGLGGLLPTWSSAKTLPLKLASWTFLDAGIGAQKGLFGNGLYWFSSWWPLPFFPFSLLVLALYPLDAVSDLLKHALSGRLSQALPLHMQRFRELVSGLCSTSMPQHRQWLRLLHQGRWLPPAGLDAHAPKALHPQHLDEHLPRQRRFVLAPPTHKLFQQLTQSGATPLTKRLSLEEADALAPLTRPEQADAWLARWQNAQTHKES